MSNLLTKSEISRLTGASTPEGQKKVLDANRISYVHRRDGTVALTWEMVNQAVLRRGASTMHAGGITIPPGVNLAAARG